MTITKLRDDGSGAFIDVMWFAKNNGRSQFNTAPSLPASAFRIAPELSPVLPINGPINGPNGYASTK